MPDQVVHPKVGFVYGHPAIREVTDVLKRVPGAGSDKIYVSRSKLEREGGFIAETQLEERLAKQGFAVVHPQEHSLSQQIAIYNGASRLIFAEGSALHLFAFVCRPDQAVYIIQRRKHAFNFAWQLPTFGLTPTVGPGPPRSLFVPESDGSDTLRGRARLDFPGLHAHLRRSGFVTGPAWREPDEKSVEAELHLLEARLRQRLVEMAPT